jgi:glycosyltransferase involved in cell wall biosynthesis
LTDNLIHDYAPAARSESRLRAPIRVFVHLARDKDASAWRRAWANGQLVGLNDPTPYGYGRAEEMGCEVSYSKAARENPVETFVRLALRAITGFDLIHTYRQRQSILAADVVWTHTESQFLAVAALLPKTGGPKVIAQSVWLFDRWKGLNPFHKWLYSRLIRRVDVLTFHSSHNMAVAKAAFPDMDCRLVPFGIPSERMTPPATRSGDRLEVIAPGSDRHRDWPTLVKAVSALPNAFATILSGTAPKQLTRDQASSDIRQPHSNEEMIGYFNKAHVVCVPLNPNKHASGITVVQEAVLAGIPVVASQAGGLDEYFGPDEVKFVPSNDPAALREALNDVARDPRAANAMAVRAQDRMKRDGMGAETYVRQHVVLSRELLGMA